MRKPRKTRAKWKRGEPFHTLGGLLDYVAERERTMRRQDIMVYCPWGMDRLREWTRGNHRGDRPTSIMVLFNMPFALVERMCRLGSICRAVRRTGDEPMTVALDPGPEEYESPILDEYIPF